MCGMRHNINVLIFLDAKKALEEGMKLYISENKVILTEGFDGVVPVKYFEKIESWPSRQPLDMGKYKLRSSIGILKPQDRLSWKRSSTQLYIKR